MKGNLLAGVLALASPTAHAKDKMLPLAEADAAQLRGKTVALTVHERPSFVAMTAGKAGFGLFGVAGMVSEGNKLVDENGVADPAIVVRQQLATLLQEHYGAQPLPVDTAPTKATKAKELAALHPEADFVLDVRSGGWSYGYYPSKWASYWVGYSAQVQLIDARSGKLLSNMACNGGTRDHANPPSREALHANNAQLLKEVTTHLGWTCARLLAQEQFGIPADRIPAVPEPFVDPLARAAGVAAPAVTPTEAPTPTGAEGGAASPSRGEGSASEH